MMFVEPLISPKNITSTYPNSTIKPDLFVCKSCHHSSEERPENQPADGTFLLDKINDLSTEKFLVNELEIQPFGYLWACSQGCVVSVSSQKKPTYLFVNLTPEDSVAAILEFLQLYIKSRKGNIAWEKFPKLLQLAIFAQIPPVIPAKKST
ncbi:MAG: hypothetical protein N4J56_007881 [Chroococcidiopsis sp. SAG 2025]|uniref:DUF1636 domain-containing protein n=1 Tax=Chroococcidiopsis sp. SAG 2025 TaxID=171389 RepID=UPI0029371A4C|nr:DUF1636 family protein [Chroococcidiopsis sp. SAG 2025]MDV2998176.1 hypothetical protein [Chroococcidiopsis sp. SAG 2025]